MKKEDYWKITSLFLGMICIILIAYLLFSFTSSLSEKEAIDKVINFLNNQTNGGVTYVSGEEKEQFYEIVVSYKENHIPVYITKDGNYIVQGLTDLNAKVDSTQAIQQESPKDIPKSDKPKADFYVFSYCPYGTQMEKALVPVYNLLKDKTDINIVFIGAMHGEYEKVESLRQLCIQKKYGKDKLFAYLDKFLVNAAVGTCQGQTTCVNPLIEAIYTQIDIDKSKINSCMSTDAEELYQTNQKQAQSLGIGGSPTTVINGVESQVGRSPALVQQAICSAFNITPTECLQTLSANVASPGFGSIASSGSTASCG